MCCVLPRDCTALPSTEKISCPSSAGVNFYSRAVSSTSCCGNTKTQGMLRASMHREREDSGSNHQCCGWKGMVKSWARSTAPLLSTHGSQAVPQDMFWGCPLFLRFLLNTYSITGQGDVLRTPVPSATQPSYLRRKAGAAFHQKMVTRSSENSTYAKRSLNFPMLAYVRYFPVELGSPLSIPCKQISPFLLSLFFFFSI